MAATKLEMSAPAFDEREERLEMVGAMKEGDPMFPARIEDPLTHYLDSARSCLRNVRLGMLLAETPPPRRILDMACGYGRQTRAFRAAFPDAEVAACDIDHEAVDFCVSEIGAIGVYSEPNLYAIEFPGTFDLIWSGSLVTHLPNWRPFFERMCGVLNPGGLLFVTTHGRNAAAQLRSRNYRYAMDDAAIDTLLADYDQEGFGFVDSSGSRSQGIEGTYGISVASCAWTCRFVEDFPLRMVGYLEYGWHAHHDVLIAQQYD